jgi:hypothetical protein
MLPWSPVASEVAMPPSPPSPSCARICAPILCRHEARLARQPEMLPPGRASTALAVPVAPMRWN